MTLPALKHKCPCCGGLTRWTNQGKPRNCDDCHVKCAGIPWFEPCAVNPSFRKEAKENQA